MNRTQALTRLRKVLGKNLGYRENPHALVGEDREAAQEISKAAVAAEAAALKALRERRVELLRNDAEYQRLTSAHQEAYKANGKASANAHGRRITVGTSNGLFFHIRAEGDNWQDVVDKLTARPNTIEKVA